MLEKIVTITGLVILCGWLFGIEFLKSIHPDWASMKITTAWCFVFSGLLIQEYKKKPLSEIRLFLYSFIILGFIAFKVFTLGFAEEILGARSGVETVAPGLPSMATMLCFYSISSVFLVSAVQPDWLIKYKKLTVAVLFGTSISALAGYITGNNYLYFYFPGVSTAVAAHTAVLFGILGISIYRIK